MNRPGTRVLLSPMLLAAMLQTAPDCNYACDEEGLYYTIDNGGGTIGCTEPTVVVLEGEVVIDRNVTIDGQGLLTLQGSTDPLNAFRVLSIPADATVELVGMTIAGGGLADPGEVVYGAGIYNEGDLTLTNVTVRDNVQLDGEELELGFLHGGGIYNSGQLTLDGSTVTGNWAAGYGSGIFNEGVAVISNSSVSANGSFFTRGLGGGIYNAGTVTMLNSLLNDNVMGNATTGGGIFNAPEGVASLVDVDISGNRADSEGAAFFNDGDMFVEGCRVTHNDADQLEVIFSRDTLTMVDTVVSDNFVTWAQIFAADWHAEGVTVVSEPGTDGCNPFGGTAISLGNNVESPGDTCGFDHPTDQVNVPVWPIPVLGPLAMAVP